MISDDEIDQNIRNSKTPPSHDDHKHLTKDVAWDALQQRQRSNFFARHNRSAHVALACACVLLFVFAGLSYTMTQSTRSGAGDTASETNLISSASLTQYPAGVRTSVMRMILAGQPITSLLFIPENLLPDDAGPELHERTVFAREGGNATYQFAPADIMNHGAGPWYFNAETQVEGMGITENTSATGNDIVSFLPGVIRSICQRINDEIGIAGIPDIKIPMLAYTANMDLTYVFPQNPGPVLNGVLSEKPFGCFRDARTGTHVYYHIIVER